MPPMMNRSLTLLDQLITPTGISGSAYCHMRALICWISASLSSLRTAAVVSPQSADENSAVNVNDAARCAANATSADSPTATTAAVAASGRTQASQAIHKEYRP